MHRYLSLLLLPMLSVPAWAEDPPAPAPAPAHHARETWQQRFTEANQAHDGHLTLDEAKSGYKQVVKHFDDIDADHKGYVTQNDIRAWRIMKKAAHRLAHPSGEEQLKPVHAMLRVPVGRTNVSASATQTVAIPSDRPQSDPGD